MAANQVVLHFEKPEDALLFTLAASSVVSRRRGSAQQQGSCQGCTGNLQSQSKHDRGSTQHHVKGGKIK